MAYIYDNEGERIKIWNPIRDAAEREACKELDRRLWWFLLAGLPSVAAAGVIVGAWTAIGLLVGWVFWWRSADVGELPALPAPLPVIPEAIAVRQAALLAGGRNRCL